MTTVLNNSYAEQGRALAGQLATARDHEIETYVQGEASAEIPFGVAVCEGSANEAGQPDDALMMVDANSKIAGVVVHAHNYNKTSQLGDTGVKPANLISVLKKGQIYGILEGTCTKGAQAFVRYSANGAGKLQIGAFRADADTLHAVVCKGITFGETKATNGDGLVLLNVDMGAYLASL